MNRSLFTGFRLCSAYQQRVCVNCDHSQTVLTKLCGLQDMYCFVLPFILKWVVVALVASVLVDVFSKLTKQGDESHMKIHDRLQAMMTERWQQCFQGAPSNSDMLLTFFRLGKKRMGFKLLPTFIRFAHSAQSTCRWDSTTAVPACYGLCRAANCKERFPFHSVTFRPHVCTC